MGWIRSHRCESSIDWNIFVLLNVTIFCPGSIVIIWKVNYLKILKILIDNQVSNRKQRNIPKSRQSGNLHSHRCVIYGNHIHLDRQDTIIRTNKIVVIKHILNDQGIVIPHNLRRCVGKGSTNGCICIEWRELCGIELKRT